MVTKEQNNEALISDFSTHDSKDTASILIVPPTPHSIAAVDYSISSTQSTFTISTLEQSYPSTTVKLNTILKKWNAFSISEEGGREVPSLMPNAHI